MEKINISISCPFCRKNHFVKVTPSSFERWQGGELIQNAMPYLSATEREQLISGMCPKCQEDIFGEDEEEEDTDDCLSDSLNSTGQWW